MADLKRNFKDSIFSYLFSQPEYSLELYRTLHPEDTHVTEADLKLVTLENILSDGIYNDLGLQVGDRIILLVESQSTFSANILLRMLLYLAATYKEYVEEHKLDLYSSRAVTIPRPELFCVFTGDKVNAPDTLKLSGLYQGEGGVEATVKVLRDDGSGDIIDQYVRFCKIADEQRKKYGYTAEAVSETIRLCLEQNILVPFLLSRKKEVQDIMITLFSQEKVTEIREFNLAKEAEDRGVKRGIEQGMEKGRAEGMEKGREQGIAAMIVSMRDLNIERSAVREKLIQQFSLLPVDADRKLSLYWDGGQPTA